MRKTLGAIVGAMALAAGSMLATSAWATDVGVSIEVSQPGVYGRVDIGRFPQPVVIQQAPVIIAQPAVVVAQPQPVYMWVPPGHRKKWGKHCHKYNACGAPVYFVQNTWYQQHVMVDERGGGGGDRGHGKHKEKHKGKGKGKD
jgi:hypothetical protein